MKIAPYPLTFLKVMKYVEVINSSMGRMVNYAVGEATLSKIMMTPQGAAAKPQYKSNTCIESKTDLSTLTLHMGLPKRLGMNFFVCTCPLHALLDFFVKLNSQCKKFDGMCLIPT